jgi:hypothetical protein
MTVASWSLNRKHFCSIRLEPLRGEWAGESMLGWARSRQTNRQTCGRTERGACVAALAVMAALGLAGCSGSMIADHVPTAMGGLPDEAPARPTGDQVYPAVHNMPPARATTTLSDVQQKALQDDLVAVRNRVDPNSATGSTGTTGNSSTAAAPKP